MQEGKLKDEVGFLLLIELRLTFCEPAFAFKGCSHENSDLVCRGFVRMLRGLGSKQCTRPNG